MSVAREWLRYVAAGLVALGVDFGTYVALIRLADVNYLLAAPAGFALGLATIYAFSVRWIFAHRRLADARLEFALFSLIGLGGMALNQAVIYGAVEWFRLSYEMAKVVSAALVFCFNFAARKLLLFTRYR
ncbi:MAG: GtrA family protein [Pseudomonadota bacterium]